VSHIFSQGEGEESETALAVRCGCGCGYGGEECVTGAVRQRDRRDRATIFYLLTVEFVISKMTITVHEGGGVE